jgi:hypothetical protein
MPAKKLGPGDTAVSKRDPKASSVGTEQPSKTSASQVKLLPFHPAADIFPLIEGQELADLVEDIRKNGLREDIDTFDGKIVDGRNRARACVEAGIEPRYHARRFNDEAGLIDFIISKNIHRRHLTAEQKRDIVARLLKSDPTASNRKIAGAAKVDKNTVAKKREEMESTGEIHQLDQTVGKDNKRRKARRAKKPKADPTPGGISAPSGSNKRTLALLNGSSPAPAPEVVAPDEELTLLREFALFFITERARAVTDPRDRDEYKSLFGRVTEMLQGRSS